MKDSEQLYLSGVLTYSALKNSTSVSYYGYYLNQNMSERQMTQPQDYHHVLYTCPNF